MTPKETIRSSRKAQGFLNSSKLDHVALEAAEFSNCVGLAPA